MKHRSKQARIRAQMFDRMRERWNNAAKMEIESNTSHIPKDISLRETQHILQR